MDAAGGLECCWHPRLWRSSTAGQPACVDAGSAAPPYARAMDVQQACVPKSPPSACNTQRGCPRFRTVRFGHCTRNKHASKKAPLPYSIHSGCDKGAYMKPASRKAPLTSSACDKRTRKKPVLKKRPPSVFNHAPLSPLSRALQVSASVLTSLGMNKAEGGLPSCNADSASID